MVKGCGPSCARIILIIFNIIFWLSGAALLALGLYLIFESSINLPFEFLAYIDDIVPGVSESLLHYAAYAIIGVGSFVILVGFCGCCGAIKESKCLLGTYIFFLVIIMLMEFAVGGVAIYFREQILDEAESRYPTLAEENYNNNTEFREVVNGIQIEFECCGWSGLADYADVTYDGATGIVPSCCIFEDDFDATDLAELSFDKASDGDGCRTMTAETYHTSSCMDELESWINTHAYILIGVGIGIACLELFGIIFACCLCRNIED